MSVISASVRIWLPSPWMSIQSSPLFPRASPTVTKKIAALTTVRSSRCETAAYARTVAATATKLQLDTRRILAVPSANENRNVREPAGFAYAGAMSVGSTELRAEAPAMPVPEQKVIGLPKVAL